MLLELKKKSTRMRNQRLLLLLVALAAAVLGVMLVHKLREGRISALLLRDRDRHVVKLQLLVQREREKSREMKRKLEDKRDKIFVLKNQKVELANKLSESKEMVDHLQTIQDEMEATLSEKQNQINMLSEKIEQSVTTNLQVAALTELAKQKEAEVEELKQRLMKLTPKENNPTAQEEIKENLPNSGEERDVSKANEGTQQEGTPTEGKWVNFQTNADDEGSKAQGEVSRDQQNKTPTNSQDNENSEEGHEMNQVNTSEIKEQSEVPNDDQRKTSEIKEKEKEDAKDEMSRASTTETQEHNEVPKNDEGKADRVDEREKEDARDGELQASDVNTSKKLEKIDSSQDGNEKQVVPEEIKMAGEGEKTTTRHGRRSKKRTRRRRKSNSRGWNLERKSDGNLGKAQNDENLSENQDNRTNIIVEGDEGLKRESQINSEGNTEAREEEQIPDTQNQEGAESVKEDQGDNSKQNEERLDDSNQQVSNTENEEGAESVEGNGDSNTTVPDDTPLEEVLKTEGQGNPEGNGEATEERPDDSNQQLPNTRNQEGAGGDDVNRIIAEEEGKKVTSTEGKPEVSENLDNDADDNGSDEKVVDTADFVQDKESGAEMQVEVMKEEEEEDAKTTSNMEQASQISQNTIDTTWESSVGELKEAEGIELTDDEENQNSEDSIA